MPIPRGVRPVLLRPRRPTLPQPNPDNSSIPPSPGIPSISTSPAPTPSSDLSQIPPTSISGFPPLVTSLNTTSSLFNQVAPTTTPFSDFIRNDATILDTVELQTSPTRSVLAASSLQTSTTQHITDFQAVCIGNGLDSSSVGILSSLIVSTAVGLVFWLLFAIVRPRFRQVYALREWFVQPDLRPKPLGTGLFAFLFPHVPLVPPLPPNVFSSGRSAAENVDLFPSDEQLSQRALWISFLIVLGWSIVGLAGALPLYLVSIPCLAESGVTVVFGGGYSVLQDLSVIRLLRLFDNGSVSSSSIFEYFNPYDDPQNARVRVIVLTALTLALGVLPALWMIIREFNRLVAYRTRFTDILCEGKELGWLSARNAPGFVGWGEKRLKEFLLETGLSHSMEPRNGRDARARNGNRDRGHRRSEEMQPLTKAEEANVEVDVQSLFSIGNDVHHLVSDTHLLALLIDERDEILENLEIAETRYIGSFRVTTPEPSVADFQPNLQMDTDRPYISHPLPLGQNATRRAQRGRRRRANPAFATSSLAPTSFVAPSMYYKLRAVRISGGRFVDSGIDQLPSIPESTNSRVTGGRFLELNHSSTAYGRLSISSPEKFGQFRPSSSVAPEENFPMSIPDPRRFGPNYAVDDSMIDEVHEFGVMPQQYDDHIDNEWVDLGDQALQQMESEPNGPIPGPSTSRRRPKKEETISSARRETFPLRRDSTPVQPPHLRLQPVQPFVRPLDGLNFDDLGHVYADITQWRSRLKAINTEIAEAQNESYNDIADGARIKGWLMVGRGLRHIPGIQLIEGRAKEDIRWDVLQNERSPLDVLVFWAIVVIVIVLLGVGLTAVSGLALSTAPDVGHYLSFLNPLNSADLIPAGLAIVFAPAVAATSFISLAIYLVHWTANVYGSISISGGHLFVFKVTFILTSVATLWLIAVGALLYSFQAFNSHTEVAKSVASGAIYMAILALAIIFTVAFIFPALLLLQPFRLWHVLHDERQAVTPRQRFRAHRYLIAYVYGRTHSRTGGLLQIWLIKRFGTLVSLQPILLGLMFLSREFWIEGGVLAGAGAVVIIFIEAYTAWKTGLPGRRSLSPITRNSLKMFESTARDTSRHVIDSDASTSNGSSSGRNPRLRGSMASVLEMMSVTLAVMPSNTNHRGPVPLQTETLDDLTATERAARTHPDAPPHLPPLAFTDHAEDMAGILYAPELIAPPPIIWLPNDSAGVARSEALDLQRYHDLTATLDVRADVNPPRLLYNVKVEPSIFRAMSSTASPLDTNVNSDPYVAYSRALYNYTLSLLKESTRVVEEGSSPNLTPKTNDGEIKKNETVAAPNEEQS
ncbi:hypothetical protein C0995_010448 [Termitomyces sp. Mi166|nr:hypothetical protein C0995_010448 [Termitomyces sp. Mi166\